MRVCALKKSKEDIEKAMRRMTQKDSKRQQKSSAGRRRFNEYIVLITSMPGEVGADEVLSAYRYRWQVEPYFERLKSPPGMGEIPKKRTECMEAWLNGKMALAVLFEVLLSRLDFPSLARQREWERRSPWREMSFFAFQRRRLDDRGPGQPQALHAQTRRPLAVHSQCLVRGTAMVFKTSTKEFIST